MYHPGVRLILASASPRRVELLRAAGYAFEAVAPDVDEAALPGESPDRYVRRVAALKARAVLARFPSCAVLGADTTVVLEDDTMLGKPVSDDEARRMLTRLSGRPHRVLTGVVVAGAGREASEVVSTVVRFAELTADDIAWYVASGEPQDKAGAYAAQGLAARFIETIDGSYSNVVGLPVSTVRALLAGLGIAPAGGGPSGSPDTGGADDFVIVGRPRT